MHWQTSELESFKCYRKIKVREVHFIIFYLMVVLKQMVWVGVAVLWPTSDHALPCD